ncbi:MAG: carbohydrate kinase [Gammaproteobacteria bacterium]|nr:carbohydrate kinase [Gammaproteobacteria bacterium]
MYIGIDVGTSGIRAIAIDEHANPLSEARQDLPSPEPQDHGREQSPAIWWTVCQGVLTDLLRTLDRRAVRAIAIDGTSATVLLTDAQGQPLTTALMYNDASASEQLARVQAVAPADNPVNAVSAGLPKIMWLREHNPSQPVRHVMHQADWLSFQLSQHAGFSDSNNCLKTGYDPVTQTWPAWIAQLGIPENWLPSVVPPGQVIGTITTEIAHSFDLPTDVRIVSGTTDSTAAIIATGAHRIGDAVTSLGSTLVCKVISDKPVSAPNYGVYSQPFGDYWLVGGASNSGGAVLRQYFTDAQMHDMSARIDPLHPTGLDYYPLPATGERFPVNAPDLEPRLNPRPNDDVQFFQGLLEGIARIEYNAYRLLHELGAPYPVSVRTVGGGAKNRAWTQLRSQQLQVDMPAAAHTEAAYGSALLAKRGYRNNKEIGI